MYYTQQGSSWVEPHTVYQPVVVRLLLDLGVRLVLELCNLKIIGLLYLVRSYWIVNVKLYFRPVTTGSR